MSTSGHDWTMESDDDEGNGAMAPWLGMRLRSGTHVPVAAIDVEVESPEYDQSDESEIDDKNPYSRNSGLRSDPSECSVHCQGTRMQPEEGTVKAYDMQPGFDALRAWLRENPARAADPAVQAAACFNAQVRSALAADGGFWSLIARVNPAVPADAPCAPSALHCAGETTCGLPCCKDRGEHDWGACSRFKGQCAWCCEHSLCIERDGPIMCQYCPTEAAEPDRVVWSCGMCNKNLDSATQPLCQRCKVEFCDDCKQILREKKPEYLAQIEEWLPCKEIDGNLCP